MAKHARLATTDELLDRFRIVPGEAAGLDRLRGRQEKLRSDDPWALRVVFQAMDATGRDSAEGEG